MKFKAAILILAVMVAKIPCATAMEQFEGQPGSGSASNLVRVMSTAPKVFKCRGYVRGTCFRLYFQITPKSATSMKIWEVSSYNGVYLYETRAFAVTGSVCEATPIGGLPRSSFGFSGGGPLNLWDEPFEMTETKPATLIAQFECDGQLAVGDEITMQMTIAVDATGHGAEVARFVFPKMLLK